MTAIPAIFDGKAFVPQQPVSLPAHSEVLVLAEGTDRAAQDLLDQAVREYYQNSDDADDQSWEQTTASDLHRTWDED